MKDAFIQIKFGGELINVRINPEIRRRFKAICDAEGESMSDKIRKWIIIHIYEHEKGNPQSLLAPREEKSLLEVVVGEAVPLEFPMTKVRRSRVLLLAKFLNANPGMKKDAAIKLFALRYDHRVSTVRRYARLLGSIKR